MPDAATWVLTLVTPATAAAVALRINATRLQQERWIARDEVHRALLTDGSALLAVDFTHETTITDEVAWAKQLATFGGQLSLWFEPGDDLVSTWRTLTAAAVTLTGQKHLKAGGKAYLGDQQLAYDHEAWERATGQFDDASKAWTAAARRQLGRLR